jgi:hypothetical protein
MPTSPTSSHSSWPEATVGSTPRKLSAWLSRMDVRRLLRIPTLPALLLFFLSLVFLASPTAAKQHALTARGESAAAERQQQAVFSLGAGSCEPPDAKDVLRSEAWGRALEVNQKITAAYARLGTLFQQILDPALALGTTTTAPSSTWFAVAPHASHEVGGGERAMKSALALLDSGTLPTLDANVRRVLTAAGVDTTTIAGNVAVAALKAAFVATEAPDLVICFMVELMVAVHHGSATVPHTLLFDKRCGVTQLCLDAITAVVKRAMALVASAPGSNTVEKLRIVAQTGLALLEHGNRLIFNHVADAAGQYLKWRSSMVGCGGVMPPEDVLEKFSLPQLEYDVAGVPASTSSTSRTKVKVVYLEAAAKLANANDDLTSILASHRCVDIMAAAFAIYEKAAQLVRDNDVMKAASWVKVGNNLMAWCEQAEAVAPAFRPAATGGAHTMQSVGDGTRPPTLPGEVNREDFMLMLTPFVKIGLNHRAWTLDDYGKRAHGSAKWTTTVNWGKFRDRYVPILHGAFKAAYDHHPRSLWPLKTK